MTLPNSQNLQTNVFLRRLQKGACSEGAISAPSVSLGKARLKELQVLGFARAFQTQTLQVCTLDVCNPRFWIPKTHIKGNIPWFRDPKPKGKDPKGTKENSLTSRAQRPATAQEELGP